ncbi:Protein QA-X [Talaromyces atroroseus]|uniref:Inositol-1-monophosphatase n=1 Tax=Talaromyces atroroseus TaxID=1441469 RepID=A0A225BF01_TALAT|nr:Protein QA-X [Talaromyces atroroseus]OKL64627.1 Protein QA-X [Talaromyces atroroseus]
MSASSPHLGDIGSAELDEIYQFAVELGKNAGQKLMDGVHARIGGSISGISSDDANMTSNLAFTEKDSSVDIVTQVDEDVEHFIHEAIKTKYPTHKFIGEETYAKTSSSAREYLITSSDPTWCVDPLDGTVNYTHMFPMFCVSIAFILGGRPIIGVIYAPMLHQLFSSCVGRGAWLNESTRLPLIRNAPASDKRAFNDINDNIGIPPMPSNAPSKCVFSCEWGKDRRNIPGGNMRRKIDSFVNMAAEKGGENGDGLQGMVHGVRSLGSATLDLAYTAMGSLDIWWEGGCWEWDVAAGIAILLEAGGLVTTANPPEDPETAAIEETKLGSRLYLAIRPAGPSATETGRQSQERTVREVWKRVKLLDYTRPGL